MKIVKIRVVLLVLALLPILSSCKLDEPESPIQELQSYEYRFSIVEETKALKGAQPPATPRAFGAYSP